MNRFTIILVNVESVYSGEGRKEGPSRKKEENGEVFELQNHEAVERLQTHRRQRKDGDTENLSTLSFKKNGILLEYCFVGGSHMQSTSAEMLGSEGFVPHPNIMLRSPLLIPSYLTRKRKRPLLLTMPRA